MLESFFWMHFKSNAKLSQGSFKICELCSKSTHKFISLQLMESVTVWKPDISWIATTSLLDRFWLHSWNRVQKRLPSISKICTLGAYFSSIQHDFCSIQHDFWWFVCCMCYGNFALLKWDFNVFSAIEKLCGKWRQASLTFGRNTTCHWKFPLTPM